MKTYARRFLIPFPDADGTETHFSVTAIKDDGIFQLLFRWIGDRWYCWATLPDGSVRQAGVIPNVWNWSGCEDYGLVFSTDLSAIGRNDLPFVKLYLLEW